MSHVKAMSVLLMMLGVCRVAAAYTDTGTLYVSGGSGGLCGGSPVLASGYASSTAMGSYSPTGLTGGETLLSLIDSIGTVCPITISGMAVSGFSSNPGQSWLSSVKCGGVTMTGSSAIFIYSGGIASWCVFRRS